MLECIRMQLLYQTNAGISLINPTTYHALNVSSLACGKQYYITLLH
jgi:hypothetical protein